MVGHQVLVLSIEVRILVPQLILKSGSPESLFSMQAEGSRMRKGCRNFG